VGGKSFPNTKPFKAENIYYIEPVIEKLLRFSFNYGHLWEIVGSGRWKRTGEIGDVDVAVKMRDDEWILFCTNIKDAGFSTKNITKHCMSVEIPSPFPMGDDPTATYQLDFNQTQSIDFSVNMFWSSATSLYKSAHRNILLQAYLNILTTKEMNLGEYDLRTKEYLDLYEGLVFLVQTTRGAKRYSTVDRRTLMSSKNHGFVSIIESFFPEILWYELDCFENVYKVLMKKYYVKDTANDMMQMIMREAGFMIQSAKLEMPHEIKCWVEFD
jgi:hypothetical protein